MTSKFMEINAYIQKQCLQSQNKKLPSENKLAQKFNCTRATISNALHLIAKNGLIYSRPGAGWYIVQNHQSFFLKSVSETITFDHKKIKVLENCEIKIDNRFNNKVDHFLKVEYFYQKKVVALLFLMVKKWEVFSIDLAAISKSTNNLYRNKIIGSIEYEVLLTKHPELNKLGNYPQLDAPILKFSVQDNAANLISSGYIFEMKENFTFKIKRNWL